MKMYKFTAFFVFTFVNYSVSAIDFKAMLIGILFVDQASQNHAHIYSVKNNLNESVGLEYRLRDNLIDAIIPSNRVTVELDCKDDKNKKEYCLLKKMQLSLYDLSPRFYTSIRPYRMTEIHTLGYPLVNIKAQILNPDVSPFQYPFCLECYKKNSSGHELDAETLSKYRTFEINRPQIKSQRDLILSRRFKKNQKKLGSQNQEQDL